MARPLAWTDAAGRVIYIGKIQGRKTLKRINPLITDTQKTPFTGAGKPGPLRENLAGF
jgi:toxin YoeB